jgi:ERCC4-type nuclease
MLIGWSYDECAHYLGGLRNWKGKPNMVAHILGDTNKGIKKTPDEQMVEALASVRKMTTNTAKSLLKKYGSLKNIILMGDYT